MAKRTQGGKSGRSQTGGGSSTWRWIRYILSALLSVSCLWLLIETGSAVISSAHDLSEAHTFDNAKTCPIPPTTSDVNCLRNIPATVTSVTNISGKNPDYELVATTSTGTLDVQFPTGNAILATAATGDEVSITLWHETPVRASAFGITAQTSTAPAGLFANDAANALAELGLATFAGWISWLLTGHLGFNRRTRAPILPLIGLLLPVPAAILLFGAGTLSSEQAHAVPVLTGVGIALVLSTCAIAIPSIRAQRRSEATKFGTGRAPRRTRTDFGKSSQKSTRQRTTLSRHPRAIRSQWWNWVQILCYAGVLAGGFFALVDGVPAHAYRAAPACAPTQPLSVTSTCRGTYDLRINSIRSPSDGSAGNQLRFANAAGEPLLWGTFTPDAAFATQASSAEATGTDVPVQVWHDSAVAVEIGGVWYWSPGNPPGDTGATIVIAIFFPIELLVWRITVRRSGAAAGSSTGWLVGGDLGQTALTAVGGSVFALGFWWWGLLVAALLLGWRWFEYHGNIATLRWKPVASKIEV